MTSDWERIQEELETQIGKCESEVPSVGQTGRQRVQLPLTYPFDLKAVLQVDGNRLQQWPHLVDLLRDLDLVRFDQVQSRTSRQFNLDVLDTKL